MTVIDNTQAKGYHKSKAPKLSKRGRMALQPNAPRSAIVLVRSTPAPATMVKDGYMFIPRTRFSGIYKRYTLTTMGDEFGLEINQ